MYGGNIELFTFRNQSLMGLVEDQMDPRKHVSFDSVRIGST
jgi:hypothetical protein